MTPSARLQAAIEILDTIFQGTAPEQALTGWARSHRFAGSGDRAAIRDHVFDAVRCKRSFAALGGTQTGRGLVLGMLRARGLDPEAHFTGLGHAPPPLRPSEASHIPPSPLPELVALDCPDWLAPALRASLGADFSIVMEALRHRAPVFLRVNIARTTVPKAIAALAEDGIVAIPHPLAPTAIEVTENTRKVKQSGAYRDGLVEPQDAASQSVIAALPQLSGSNVLDYCAGGGGKSLAMAAMGARVSAHDANPQRMLDLPKRAARARASIELIHRPEGEFDLVLTDVPCSGSGSWRRDPGGKWVLTADALSQLVATQSQILSAAARHVAPQGWLAYVTCSLLDAENSSQIDAFTARDPAFTVKRILQLTPSDGGDGFFLGLLQKRR